MAPVGEGWLTSRLHEVPAANDFKSLEEASLEMDLTSELMQVGPIQGSTIFTGRIEPGELIEAALVGRVLHGSHPYTAHRTFSKGEPSSWLLSDFRVVRRHRDDKYESFYLESTGSDSAMLVDVMPEKTDVRITSSSDESITELLERLATIEESLEVPGSRASVGIYL